MKMVVSPVRFVLQIFKFWSIAAEMNIVSGLFNIHGCGTAYPHFHITVRMDIVGLSETFNFFGNLFI